MATAWDVISSLLALVIFLGVVYAGAKLTALFSSSTASTKSSLSSKGVTYANGRLSVKTDTPAPSREAYIAQTQHALERGARRMQEHRDAFRVGGKSDAGVEVPDLAGTGVGAGAGASASAVDGDKKGFRRTRKLA
ncbi:hypothetical protein Q5752_003206 [Cryptotrichosporon argae]